MADPNLIYDPPTGHEDTTVFPTNPAKETVRGLFQRLHNQTRDFINDTLIPWINVKFPQFTDVLSKTNTTEFIPTASYHPATKKYVDDTTASVVLGQVPDGSITDGKLSNGTGQIKDTVSKYLADYEYQIATVVSRQIILTKQSNTKILKFMLNTAIPNGTGITISLDGGITSKPLNNFAGVAITNLEVGFVEVIADATFFTLRPRGGSNVKSVQKGFISFSSSGTLSNNITISAVDVANSVVRITKQIGTTSATVAQTYYMAEIINSTTLQISRTSGHTSTDTIFWEIIEFQNVKSLQKYTGEIATSSLTISPVNPQKTIVFGSQKTASTSTGIAPREKYQLNGTDKVDVLQAPLSTNTDIYHIQVIEF